MKDIVVNDYRRISKEDITITISSNFDNDLKINKISIFNLKINKKVGEGGVIIDKIDKSNNLIIIAVFLFFISYVYLVRTIKYLYFNISFSFFFRKFSIILSFFPLLIVS